MGSLLHVGGALGSEGLAMSTTKWFLLVATLILWGSTPPLRGADKSEDPDEEVLRRHKVGTDDASLHAFLRTRRVNPRRLKELVRQLGDDDFAIREKASARLMGLGRRAVPLLNAAAKSPDVEVARRAHKCLKRIRERTRISLDLFVVRRLVRGHSPGTLEALLRYLPYAADESVQEEIWYGLESLAVDKGGLAPALVAALRDPLPERRAVAACLLGHLGREKERKEARRLLKDANAWVRLRAAQGLLAGGETVGVPTFIELVGSETPLPLAWQAEELLHWAAGKSAPEVTLEDGRKAQRQRCRLAWEKWWGTKKGEQGWFGKEVRCVAPRLFLVGERGNQSSVIWLCGCDGSVRWRLRTAAFLTDAHLVGGDHILLCDYGSRNLQGSVRELTVQGRELRLWSKKGAQRCWRLPNGNTLIWSLDSFELFEITQRGEEVYRRAWPREKGLPRAFRLLEDGKLFYVAEAKNQFVVGEFDAMTNKGSQSCLIRESQRWHVLTTFEDRTSLLLQESFRPKVPNKHCLFSRRGVLIRSYPAKGEVVAGMKTRAGRIVIANKGIIVEMTALGKTVWEAFGIGRAQQIQSLHPCLRLVSVGFKIDDKAIPDYNSVAERLAQSRSRNATVRDHALWELARQGPAAAAAAPALVEALNDPTMEELAGKALREIGPPAVPALVKAMRDERFRVRFWATENLAVVSGFSGKVTQYYVQALRDPDRRIRSLAASARGAFGANPVIGVPALARALHDKHIDVSTAAVITLGALGSSAKEAVPALIEIIKHGDKRLRERAINTLGAIGPKAEAAVPALVSLVRKRDPNLCGAAVMTLGRIGYNAGAAVPVLVSLVRKRDPKYCGAAVVALGSIGPKAGAAVPFLVALIKKRDPSCEDAVKALGRMGLAAKEAVPTLAELLEDKELRDAAVVALTRLGLVARAAIPALDKASRHSDRSFAYKAFEALYRVKRH
jgi:HEAT repeat protein